MDNLKDDRYYTDKMLNDLTFIQEHINGKDYDAFSADEILQDSMMFRLIQISESARKLSDSYREAHADIPWSDVFGLRNRIVHEYGGLDLTIVYDTLINDIPDLIRAIQHT